MTDTIKAVIYRIGQAPVIEEHPNTLEASQALVGGLIEYVPLSDAFCLICNEEGKLNGLAPNREAFGIDVIVGNFFVCREGEDGEMHSVEDTDLATVRAFFGDPYPLRA